MTYVLYYNNFDDRYFIINKLIKLAIVFLEAISMIVKMSMIDALELLKDIIFNICGESGTRTLCFPQTLHQYL